MAGLESYRRFRDPIHHFIDVTRLEAELIDSPPFQRLRHIRQLALTCYVYPGAEHRRFAHSLGVMQFGSRILDTLVAKGLAAGEQWSDDDIARQRQLLRLACLLHDVGHPPFSHVGEDQSLLPHGMKHEDYSYQTIHTGEMAEILADSSLNTFMIRPDEITAVLTGTAGGILSEIINGHFDADKMDYLRRDSWHAGVEYGTFDHERFIESLTFRADDKTDGQPVLAIEEGGIHAAEAMVLARYWMFTQVYFHDVRRAYDWHLGEFIRELLQQSTGEDTYPEEIGDYMQWNDVRVLAALQNTQDSEKGDRLLHRQHWRVCAQTTAAPETVDVAEFSRSAAEACKVLGSAFVDYATQHRLRLVSSADFQVRREGGNQFAPIGFLSPVIRSVPPICQARMYAAPDVLPKGLELMPKKFTVTREAAG